MIVVRNTKDGQRKSQSSQSTSPAAYLPPMRMAALPETIQVTTGRAGVGFVERTRLSREASGHSFRNDARALTVNGSENLFATGSPAASNDIGARFQPQRPYTHRSGPTPLPPRPTIWSNNGSHFTQRRLPESGPTSWHHHQHHSPANRHVGDSRNYQQGQPWKENRDAASSTARQPQSILTRAPPSIHNRSWEWRGQSESRNDSRAFSQEHHPSQREWSTNGHWHGSGNGHGMTTIMRKEDVLAGRPAVAYHGSVVSSINTAMAEKHHTHDVGLKRSQDDSDRFPPTLASLKRSKGLDMLDLLCQATLDVGPMQDNPTGCSCPKSKCIALYCDCFKAGRRCDEKSCGCVDCKNTLEESGVDGARTKAIRSILARNPRAFITAGVSAAEKRAPPGEIACNCIRSKCLKLYCSCFQTGKTCTQSCTCVGCANTEEDSDGERKLAVQLCLEKRPDAFQQRVREPGLGCACKNNRCVRKYCECFRSNLVCTNKCTCRRCENLTPNAIESQSTEDSSSHNNNDE